MIKLLQILWIIKINFLIGLFTLTEVYNLPLTNNIIKFRLYLVEQLNKYIEFKGRNKNHVY